MIPGGYYIKARCIQDSDISTAPPHVREIWDWLLKEANHSPHKTILRGQMVKTLQDISDGLVWKIGYRQMRYTTTQCENALKFLRKKRMIYTTRTTRGIIIDICKYDYYQNQKNYESNNKNDKNVPQKNDAYESDTESLSGSPNECPTQVKDITMPFS